MKKKILIWTAILIIIFLIALFLEGGNLTKPIQGPDGITIHVARNFPRPSIIRKKDLSLLSFNLKPHEDSKRYINFFQLSVSSSAIDTTNLLPEKHFMREEKNKETIAVNGHTATLTTTPLEINLPCGSKETKQLYTAEFFCDRINKHIQTISYTVTKKTFLETLKTIKCH